MTTVDLSTDVTCNYQLASLITEFDV